jgi:uncharacterized protein (DUF1800 family)
MANNIFIKNKHLAWRSGFGHSIKEYAYLQTADTSAYVDEIIKRAKENYKPLFIADRVQYEKLIAENMMERMAMSDTPNTDKPDVVKEEEKSIEKRKRFEKLRKLAVRDLTRLNLAWCKEMVESTQQLREKMALFWHGHFATRIINAFHQELYLEVLRKNAIGNFGDLVRQVSKTASMIAYLNNNQNKKTKPNENFARELLELFTLGRGNYKEKDIKEAARAFTGWNFTPKGDFDFKPGQHDTGVKTFMGVTGNLTGDDIINIILKNKQTATFIVTKLYKYLVNENVDASKVAMLAEVFYNNNLELEPLLKAIFKSDWFYQEQHIGAKIKSPVELLIGIQRTMPISFVNPGIQLVFQRILGQVLFYPPNVAGWPGGKTWIDSSTLMVRLKLPQQIIEQKQLTTAPKDDDDVMAGMKDAAENETAGKRVKALDGKVIRANIKWDVYNQIFGKTERKQLFDTIEMYLLQPKRQQFTDQSVLKYVDQTSRESFIRTASLSLLSIPEYQLC